MSKISLSGDASGTGTLTIQAPNTNSNYTLTLPTNTGTVMTSASDTFSGGLTLGGDLTLDSNGIYLGGTGAANYLDDYEEGTFNMGGTPIYTTTCYYIKVGNLVTLMGEISVGPLSETSFTNNSLPFTADSSYAGAGGLVNLNDYTDHGSVAIVKNSKTLVISLSATAANLDHLAFSLTYKAI